MILLLREYRIFDAGCQHVKTDQGDLVIAFERSGLLFVFNLHPNKSYTDYGLAVDAGKYKSLLSTDQAAFGGFDRYDMRTEHRSMVERSFGLKHRLQLYLPSRTGVVLQRQPIPRVR
jgi:1,4-alpha-glucan branching enzyme